MSITENQSNKTLTDIVYVKIRDDIIHGDLQPGSKLRIEPLRKRYDIGASPIREALSRLCSDGFVAIKGQQGFSVIEMSKANLHDLTNTRVLIENQALKLSIEHGDYDWEANLVAAFHRLSKFSQNDNCQDSQKIEPLNKAFHDALLAACDSKLLIKLYNLLYDQHKRYRLLSREATHLKRDTLHEHQVIYEAALAKNIDIALQANEQHIRNTEDVVMTIEKDEWG